MGRDIYYCGSKQTVFFAKCRDILHIKKIIGINFPNYLVVNKFTNGVLIFLFSLDTNSQFITSYITGLNNHFIYSIRQIVTPRFLLLHEKYAWNTEKSQTCRVFCWLRAAKWNLCLSTPTSSWIVLWLRKSWVRNSQR